jgi:rRNA processing protein Krr1/Pno1
VLRDERVCVVSGPPAAVAAAVAQAKLVASEGDGPPGPWSDRDGARSVRRGDEGGDFAERVVPCSGLGPGRVIGKGGATVKRLQEDFGVRVDVRTEDGQCFVSGAGAENVDACAAEVARIIEEGDGYVPVGYEEGGFGDGDVRSRSRAPRFAGFDPTRARSMGSSSSQTLETLAFRTELEIGRIIGRGGATVRAIEEDTGARVQVDKRTLECVVSGSEAAVGAASRTIRRVAEEGFGGAVRRIPCGGSEGLIIGPGGARVRALAARTKARIDVEKVSEFHSECVIRGNPDAVAQAADAVERALAEEGGGGFDERGGRYVAYERGGGDRHAYDDRERPRRGYDAYPRDAAEEYRRPRDDAYSRDEAYASRDDAARRRRRFPEDRGGRGGGGRGGGGRPRWSDRGGGDRGDRYADGWD